MPLSLPSDMPIPLPMPPSFPCSIVAAHTLRPQGHYHDSSKFHPQPGEQIKVRPGEDGQFLDEKGDWVKVEVLQLKNVAIGQTSIVVPTVRRGWVDAACVFALHRISSMVARTLAEGQPCVATQDHSPTDYVPSYPIFMQHSISQGQRFLVMDANLGEGWVQVKLPVGDRAWIPWSCFRLHQGRIGTPEDKNKPCIATRSFRPTDSADDLAKFYHLAHLAQPPRHTQGTLTIGSTGTVLTVSTDGQWTQLASTQHPHGAWVPSNRLRIGLPSHAQGPTLSLARISHFHICVSNSAPSFPWLDSPPADRIIALRPGHRVILTGASHNLAWVRVSRLDDHTEHGWVRYSRLVAEDPTPPTPPTAEEEQGYEWMDPAEVEYVCPFPIPFYDALALPRMRDDGGESWVPPADMYVSRWGGFDRWSVDLISPPPPALAPPSGGLHHEVGVEEVREVEGRKVQEGGAGRRAGRLAPIMEEGGEGTGDTGKKKKRVRTNRKERRKRAEKKDVEV